MNVSSNHTANLGFSNGTWNTTKLTTLGSTSLSGSLFSILFSHSYLFDSAKLIVAGTVIETGRRLSQWLIERFRIQYFITAQFEEGDPSYEWIVLFLTQENVWRRSRDFRVSSKTSLRKWSVQTDPNPAIEGNADYVPTYDYPQLFRYNGYWVEIRRSKSTVNLSSNPLLDPPTSSTIIYLTVYTLNMAVMSNLVEDARRRYIHTSRPSIITHTVDAPNYGPIFNWNNVKRKPRRPLNTIILPPGTIESIHKDLQEFLDSEEWYAEAGIPYRRGYLLFGPPGTGKTSTVYGLAGELGLEIYSLSLSSRLIDDWYLQRAASSIPKMAIFLIEDIDCAFPSREEEKQNDQPLVGYLPGAQSSVTLSALLNVIDGIGSEEGRLFFATTNDMDRLDPALIRPGRIDVKISYSLATKEQVRALFERFFPESRFGIRRSQSSKEKGDDVETEGGGRMYNVRELADSFAASVPENTFSTAELQGYLLTRKRDPLRAVEEFGAWAEDELRARREREEREKEREKAKTVRVEVVNDQAASVPDHGGSSSGKVGPELESAVIAAVSASSPIGKKVVVNGISESGVETSGDNDSNSCSPPISEEGTNHELVG